MLRRGELPGALAGKWTLTPAALPAWWAALADAQRRGPPGEGGVVLGSEGSGPTPSPHKKKRGKRCPGCCMCLKGKGLHLERSGNAKVGVK